MAQYPNKNQCPFIFQKFHTRHTGVKYGSIQLMGSHAVTPIMAKTGITRAVFPDSFLVSLYRALAPYRGCGHGCRYCDGRAEKYYVEGDFERDIALRTNLNAVIAADIAKGVTSREWGAICIGSGVTDVYQPLERNLEATRRSLAAMIPTGKDQAEVPIVILTKSDLILRDFDLLSQFPQVLVIVTITTVNPDHAAKLEPGASTPTQRLEVVRRAKEAGFASGIMAMPLCPGISDTDESVSKLFDAAIAAGADFVYPGGLTLRPGRQKECFTSLVDTYFPEHRKLYDRVYRQNRQSGMPVAEYAEPLMKKLNTQLSRRGVPQMIPHRVYRNLLSPPDALFVLLCHMQDLYAMRGIDIRPLKSATDRYAAWLKAERGTFRRKRIPIVSSDPFPITRALTEKLQDLCRIPDDDKKSKFAELCGNERLARLAAKIVIKNNEFDYANLTIK